MFRNLLDHSAVLQDERNELLAESCLYELLTLEMKRQDSLWKKCLDAGIHIDRANQYIALFPKNEKNETLKEYFVGMKRDDPVSSAYKINVFGNLYIWLVCTDESREEITQKLDAFRQNGAEFEVGRILSDAEKIKETYELAIREVRRAYGNVEDYPKMELEALQEAILAGEDSRIEVLLKNLREIIMQVGDTTAILVSFETFSMLGADVQKLYGLVKEGSFSRKDVLTLYDHAAAGRSAAAREKEKRPVPGNAGCQKRSITEVLTYLHEHVLDPDFSVKHMAACFDTSVSNLSHFFKKNMEVSLSAYVDRIKLDKAKELLRKSNMKIGEIAEILQYGSSTGFSVMFKKYEGMSPKEYRDQETEEE